MEDQPRYPSGKPRGMLERHRRAQADAADVVLTKAQPVDEGLQERRLMLDGEGWLAGRRFAAAGQVGNDHPSMSRKGGRPRVKVLKGPDEAVTEHEWRARSLVEVTDAPAADLDVLDALRAERPGYSPVSIWARCSRPE